MFDNFINQNKTLSFMAISQSRSRRKPSGALYRPYRKKKEYELGSSPTFTKLGNRKVKQDRILGGHIKYRLLNVDYVNVFSKGKCQKIKINNVIETPANRHYVRRNIITKGTVVETEIGKVKITSRPGQEGGLNGILVTTS